MGERQPPWPSGTVIRRSERVGGRLWAASPARVVDDADGQLVLFHRAGTGRVRPEGGRASVLHLQEGGAWRLAVSPPSKVSYLVLVAPGRYSEVRVVWDQAWHLLGWYVNLQRPIVRTKDALETRDLFLDVWLRANEVVWKDEEELAGAIERRVVSAEDARAARDEASRVVSDWQRQAPPFGDRWEAWRPPEAWGPLWSRPDEVREVLRTLNRDDVP